MEILHCSVGPGDQGCHASHRYVISVLELKQGWIFPLALHCAAMPSGKKKNKIKICTCKFTLIHCSFSSCSGVNFPSSTWEIKHTGSCEHLIPCRVLTMYSSVMLFTNYIQHRPWKPSLYHGRTVAFLCFFLTSLKMSMRDCYYSSFGFQWRQNCRNLGNVNAK